MPEAIEINVLRTTFDQVPLAEESWPCRICQTVIQEQMPVWIVGVPVQNGNYPMFTCSEEHARVILDDIADKMEVNAQNALPPPLLVNWRVK